MKFKTTRKAIMANYGSIISVGYGDLQHLLAREEAAAYTAGADSWNADIYTFGGVAIVTGYRPFGNIDADYTITRCYDDKAREIVNNWDYQGDKKEALRNLIREYIAAVRT